MIHILRLLSSLFSQLFGNETEVITMRNHTNVGYLRNKYEVSVGFAGGKPSPQSRVLFFSVASGRLLQVFKPIIDLSNVGWRPYHGGT